MSSPTAKNAERWSRVPVLMALIGWLVLAATYFLYIPIFHSIWLFVWPLIGVGWLWAALWSWVAVMSYLSIRRYGRALAGLVIAVAFGAALWTTDWPVFHVRSVLWLEHEAFAELAADYEKGKPLTVPAWMRYLAVDGDIQAQKDGLYFPVFVDLWRAETGRGFAYVPVARGREPVLQTAEGDLGSPTRHLGGGWWWVD
ncbi:hypothetical protein [Nonomuraea roseola]|uniref:Uncharacterized protein n=1 Tax=Nonomuraea roseola TaxID=46179 RepID=A0ABV5PWH9_9ACTN